MMSPLRGNLVRWGILTIMFCSLSTDVIAQVSFEGIVDVTAGKGGKDSRPGWNGMPNSFLGITIPQLRLFAQAQISDLVWVDAMIANEPIYPDKSAVSLKLAYVTVADIIPQHLNIAAGKILTPFGSYPKRQLSPDNPFIGKPLFFQLPLAVSIRRGYLDSLGIAQSYSPYGSYGDRLTSIYNGAYYTGVEAYGDIISELVQYDVAVMNAPLSSPSSDINYDEELAFHGRVSVTPAIWGTFGCSYAVGSFMLPDYSNAFLDASGGLTDFKQRTIGADARLSYLYYELNVELLWNQFEAPYVVTTSYPYKNGTLNGRSMNLDGTELLIDMKVDLPWSPGIYIAGRYDMLRNAEIVNPDPASSKYRLRGVWSPNVDRFAIVAGYKIAHGTLLKIGYEDTFIDIPSEPKLEVLSAMLVVRF